jgi:CRISPR/Cas system-associated endoribonuclease Cas2
VFEAELNKEQFERLLALLEQLIDVAQDHICFYPLSFGFQRINVGGAEMDDGFLFV